MAVGLLLRSSRISPGPGGRLGTNCRCGIIGSTRLRSRNPQRRAWCVYIFLLLAKGTWRGRFGRAVIQSERDSLPPDWPASTLHRPNVKARPARKRADNGRWRPSRCPSPRGMPPTKWGRTRCGFDNLGSESSFAAARAFLAKRSTNSSTRKCGNDGRRAGTLGGFRSRPSCQEKASIEVSSFFLPNATGRRKERLPTSWRGIIDGPTTWFWVVRPSSLSHPRPFGCFSCFAIWWEVARANAKHVCCHSPSK